jgi:hypothetical protein
MTKKPTKQELLDHYARREPQAFMQLDGFDCPGDSFSDPETGLALSGTETWELMRGADVRILVKAEADREKVLRILREMVDWVEKSKNIFTWSACDPDYNIQFPEYGGAVYRGVYHGIRSEADLEALRRVRAADLEVTDQGPEARPQTQAEGTPEETMKWLMRCKVPLVTRDRRPWHGAVEEEVCRGLGRDGGCAIDAVVNAVLSRDWAFPADPVRRYAQYILETSAGVR